MAHGDGAAPSPLPRVGAVVSLELDGASRTWRTRVEWAAGANVVVVAPTRPLGGPVEAPDPERQVTLGWPTEAGYFEALGSVTGEGTDTVAQWTVQVHTVRQRQRRSAFRLPASLAVAVSVAHLHFRGESRDISEGGLRCLLPRGSQLAVGEHVDVTFTLPEEGDVAAGAKVVRRIDAADGVDIGLSFVDEDPDRSEAIRQFVFTEQLKRRRADTRR